MTVLEPTGEILERQIDGIGTLRFENFGPGEWFTQKGAPAKVSRRRYLLNGEELDTVSSIVDNLSKPGLYYWYEDHGARGGARAQELGELDGVAPEEIIDRVRLLDLGATAVKDEASDRGKAIHAGFEGLAYGRPVRLDDYPAKWHAWIQGAARAWLALDPEPHEVEYTVCNPPLGYAGRPDIVATSKGKRTLLDYKTGKGKVFDAAHYQTRLYEMARIEMGLEPVDQILIVGIDDQGNYQLVECEATEDDVLALLLIHRGRKRINAGMAAQRKAAKG